MEQERQEARASRPRLRPGGRGRAFTLVEVLAVVAVLALLLALLVPSLGRSKDMTVFTACKGRLRRVGMGVIQYAQANRGWLVQTPTLQNPLIEVARAYHLDHPYVQPGEDLYCPALQTPDLVYTPENLQGGRLGYFYYCAQKPAGDPSLPTFLRHLTTWPRNLSTWSHSESWVFSDIFRSGECTAHSMFKKGVNYLMLSGEVGSTTESPRESFH